MQTETMHERDANIETYTEERYVESETAKRGQTRLAAPSRPSNGGIGVACGAAVADGGGPGRGG